MTCDSVATPLRASGGSPPAAEASPCGNEQDRPKADRHAADDLDDAGGLIGGTASDEP